MNERYHIVVTKDYLVFSAAHFITFNGDVCERLHGHNYRLSAELYGPLDDNHYVVDFIAVRDLLKQIVDRLDHRMLVPTSHPLIQLNSTDHEVELRFRERRWVFPLSDCILLPVPNTTTELLARFIGQELSQAMSEQGVAMPERLKIGVDENNGQWGYCEFECPSSDQPR